MTCHQYLEALRVFVTIYSGNIEDSPRFLSLVGTIRVRLSAFGVVCCPKMVSGMFLPDSSDIPGEAVEMVDRGLFLVHPLVELARLRVASFELLHAAFPPQHLPHLVISTHAEESLY